MSARGGKLVSVAALTLWCSFAHAERNIDKQLRTAVRAGDINSVETLMSNGADADKADALFAAIEGGSLPMLDYLLKKGVDPNVWRAGRLRLPAGAEGSAVFQAARLHNAVFLKLLRSSGADINAESLERGSEGETPLIVATRSGDLEAVALLVESGADVNHRTRTGNTALLEAIQMSTRAAKLVDWLLAHGADPDIKGGDGRSARDYAYAFGSVGLNAAIQAARPLPQYEQPGEVEHIRKVLILKAGCDLADSNYAQRVRLAYRHWREPRARTITRLESEPEFQRQRTESLLGIRDALTATASAPASHEVPQAKDLMEFRSNCATELAAEFPAAPKP
jgi:hypothetical protein